MFHTHELYSSHFYIQKSRCWESAVLSPYYLSIALLIMIAIIGVVIRWIKIMQKIVNKQCTCFVNFDKLDGEIILSVLSHKNVSFL